RLAFGLDADDCHRPRDPLAAVLKMENAEYFDGGGHTVHVVAGGLFDGRHQPVRVGRAVVVDGFDDHVGQNAVQPVAHLRAETGHHAIDHNHRGHAEHHADDACEGDIPRLEIPQTEQNFVHAWQSFA